MVSSRLSSFLSSQNFSGSATNPAGSGCAPFVRSLLRAQEPDVFLSGLDEKPLDLTAVRDGLLDLLQEARRFSPMYSNLDFLDMLHMPLVYYGAQYLTNGPISKEPTFLTGCTLF